MLLLRAALLEVLVCFHVIGGAVLFRRLFPRESPWLAFILPTFGVMAVFNFVEHFIALPDLGWLLPISVGGLLWCLIRPGYSWEGLRLPAIAFVVIFTWALFIKCMNPEITCNTEGVADMARVLDFCVGDKVPPTDTWCPPYDHSGYYTFQHYGASLLKRLFSLDIGTGYNMGFTLLNTLTCLTAMGAAYVLSGQRLGVAIATLIVVLGNFSGSAVLLLFHPFQGFDWSHPDFQLSIDINDSDDHARNPFWWIAADRPNHPGLRLFTPAFNFYFPEFHANLGGHFMVLASLLAGHEAFRPQRSNWPWVCLLLFPLITIIMSTWFLIVVGVFCLGGLGISLACGRRPENWRFVLLAAGVALMCVWPSVNDLLVNTHAVHFYWTWEHPQDWTPFWTFIFQWWPIYIPWFVLFFVWGRLSAMARFIHLAIPVLLVFVEIATFENRVLTVEKMWGALYGAGLVTFLPLIFMRPHPLFRLLSLIFVLIGAAFVCIWAHVSTQYVNFQTIAFHLEGSTVFKHDAQKTRLLQVMQRLHNVTILPGESTWSYNQAPSLIGFAGDRCYIAWFYQEYQCGHGGEAEYRDEINNSFYAGKMADPLPFLRSNDIAGVLIWPEDQISDAQLAQFHQQLDHDYYYVDCRPGGPNNAGLFIRLSPGPSAAQTAPAAPVAPPPSP